MNTIITLLIMQIISKFIWYSISIIAGGFLLTIIVLAIYGVIKDRVIREKAKKEIKEKLEKEN